MFTPEVTRNLKRILYVTIPVIIITFLLANIVAYFEAPVNSGFDSFSSIYWWWIVTIATVGFGDIAPITFEGRLVASVIIGVSFIFFAFFVSEMSNLLRQIISSSERGLKPVRYEGHIVILGYNSMFQMIVNLISDEFHTKRIVLVSNQITSNPMPRRVDFVYGDITQYKVLASANIIKASACIILANDNYTNPDAHTIVVASEVESINKDILTIVEVLDENLVELYKFSKIDHFIDQKNLIKEVISEDSDSKLINLLKNYYKQQ